MDSVSICNGALMTVGIPTIVSFEDENINAKLCREFYPLCVDKCLADHSWSFALKCESLVQLAGTESHDPTLPVCVGLPTDMLQVVALASGRRYKRFGRMLLIESLPEKVVYISKIKDPEQFDPNFVFALQLLLASRLAVTTSKNVQLANYFETEYNKAIALARSIDSRENVYQYQIGRNSSGYLDARR